jgi:ankyrin repeat protein
LLHVLAKVYEAKELQDALIQKLLDYGISVNSKNNQGMTPLHSHLDNWDPDISKTAVQRTLYERFHERHEIPLLNFFRG